MKRIFFLVILIFSSALIYAQTKHGLQGVIVEKYYVSDAHDSAVINGHLLVGSVTYRIFVNMLPACRFQAAYGVSGHELRIATTTSFYNNVDAGAAVANDVPKSKLGNNTVMLDSWLSVGAGAEGTYAVLKSDDTSKAITNVDGLLQNADASAGIPIKIHDGNFPFSPMPVVSFFGMDSTVLSIFKNINAKLNGQIFSTNNGSWASFGGAIGAPPHNKVLIAQITTDGEFSFELNIQIGTPDGKTENYVARNPAGKEIQFDDLIYHAPTEKISSTKNN